MEFNEQQVVGLPVETRSGQYLGRVRAVERDEVTDKIIRLLVRPSWLKRLWCRQFVIHRDQVIKVLADKIIVDDAVSSRRPAEALEEPRLVPSTPK